MMLDEQSDLWNSNEELCDFNIDDFQPEKDWSNFQSFTVSAGPLSPPDSVYSNKKLQTCDFEKSLDFESLLEEEFSNDIVYSDKMLSGANCNFTTFVQNSFTKSYRGATMSPASSTTSPSEKNVPKHDFKKSNLGRQLSLLDNDQAFNINKYIHSEEIAARVGKKPQEIQPIMKKRVSNVFVTIPVQKVDDLNTPDITDHVIKIEEDVSLDNFDIVAYIEDPNKTCEMLNTPKQEKTIQELFGNIQSTTSLSPEQPILTIKQRAVAPLRPRKRRMSRSPTPCFELCPPSVASSVSTFDDNSFETNSLSVFDEGPSEKRGRGRPQKPILTTLPSNISHLDEAESKRHILRFKNNEASRKSRRTRRNKDLSIGTVCEKLEKKFQRLEQIEKILLNRHDILQKAVIRLATQ